MKFKNLHNQKKPLLIANVWDVQSVKIAEELNFQAIGTSSAAIAVYNKQSDVFERNSEIIKKPFRVSNSERGFYYEKNVVLRQKLWILKLTFIYKFSIPVLLS
ncbi:MAG: isocitrate lyase/phosphoenolpyruvate mutase family protein [Bergeyella sp.]